jgi:Fe(II)/alpha-ketoglutarate-dependent arginine beta-hydroxylase
MVYFTQNSARWLIDTYRCTAQDTAEISSLLEDLSNEYSSAEDIEFLMQAPFLAHRLPASMRKFLLEARARERFPAYVISCSELIQDIGPTPENWWSIRQPTVTGKQEMALVLMGALVGETFAWATQQDGRMIHDVLPIVGHEHEQIGSSSMVSLSWHTEDAFHPFRADYVALACMRNPDKVATTLLAIDQIDLPESTLERLMEKRYFILPDNSHLPKSNPANTNDDAFTEITKMFDHPTPVAAIFGPRETLYLRVDPDFMQPVPGDAEAEEALRELFTTIERELIDVALEPGDFLFIDNFRCAHGRRPFIPRYDGKDRWLKRVNISRDLRPAKAAGACRGFRIMH